MAGSRHEVDVARPAGAKGASDTFIRIVAHDLRASLNAIVGWGELVKAGRLSPDDSVRAGETIVRHTRHLSQRLDDALDLWRVDVGALAAVRRDTPVGPAVRAAIDAARLDLDGRRLEVGLDVQVDALVHVDAQRLVRALVLILKDVAVNTPAGHRVDVMVASQDAQVDIRIVSEGLMPDGLGCAPRPMEPRSGDSRRPFDFGLSLARALVELNGGALEVASDDGGRVAFLVRLATAASTART